MATVVIAGRAVVIPDVARRPKMVLRGGGATWTAPFAPVSIDHGGFGWRWETVERSGREPLLLRSQRNTRTIAFRLALSYTQLQTSIEGALYGLERMANAGDTCTVAYSRAEAGRWRITGLDYTVTARNVANQPSRAEVNLEFTRASDAPRQIGYPPAKKPAPPKKGKPAAKPKPKKSRTYTVRRGDTLRAIAHRFYRDSGRWKDIAKANKITNPRKLQVGRKLRIP